MWGQFVTRSTKLPLKYPSIFVLGSVVVAAAISLLGGYALMEMHRDAMARAAESSQQSCHDT
ncbi:hypothetical protein LMG23994_04569 [Cupriavidus pinatubonensis]|uniref:Transmembrane protein n=1 Tax=Cupriavidus pinatubonensis TaxID=248026 RepID=A0ABM8XLR5_9BURK|nr:hypothetical protein LMG23994_04569 [Cupriavidus pinatubonensis]